MSGRNLRPSGVPAGQREPFGLPRGQLRNGISVFDGRAVTRVPFAQLADDVARARERLARAGLQTGTCVGLLGENCYEWIVYDLAVLSLRCISVCFPLDEFAETPAEELAARYDLSLLLVTKKRGGPGEPPWVMVINASEAPAATVRPVAEKRGLRRRVRGTDVCSVIFSSGTTGKLKALLLSRAGVDVTIDALADDWQMGPDDGILVALPLSIFQQRLMVYAALRKDTEILLTNSFLLFQGLKALRPTIVLAPPALFEVFENRSSVGGWRHRGLRLVSAALTMVPSKRLRRRLRRGLFRSVHDALGGRIRVLLTGSAPSKLSTLEFFGAAGLPLFQAYGLAEVGFIAWNRPGANRLLSVGRPLCPGSVSIAEDGEIIVSARRPQALGYFGVEPAEEALTFRPDGRIATGDLGRFDRDGYLYVTGRKKDLILMQSGDKIHPESLEMELATVPGVERAVVLGGGELPWLVAVVAVAPDCTADAEARIRSDLQSAIDRLNKRVKPACRIVRFITTRVAFRPETGLVTRNLKLDRRAVYRFFEQDLIQHEPQARGAR